MQPPVPVAGLLLAAGAGRRMGRPKALLVDEHHVPFLDRAVGVLFDGGCSSVTVVLGASAAEAAELLREAGWLDDEFLTTVVASDWAEGMGASLRAGLAALDASGGEELEAALVSLVDLQDVGHEVVRRVLADRVSPWALARATYRGRPGHPVLLGRDHWAGVMAAAVGDQGARDYLARTPHDLVECGDLATGRDMDLPADLR